MDNLKINLRFLVLPLLALLFLALPTTQASAHLASFETRSTEMMESNLKIKVIIIIFFKKKKKGVYEVAGMRLAEKGAKVGENQILMEVSLQDSTFFIMPMSLKGDQKGFLVMPSGFKVSKEVGLKLGEKGGFSLKAGKIELAPNSLGNFEIQR